VDKANNIGSIGVGRVPIRAKGDALIPVPGWSGDYAWTGYIPFDEMPQKFNPEVGYIVSANNKPVDDSYPYFISNNWAPPARAKRIEQMLQGKIAKGQLLSTNDFEGIQGDTLDLSAQRLLGYLKRLSPNGAEQKVAIDYLASWQGDMTRDSQAAAIFFVWARYLREDLFVENLKKYWNKQWDGDQLKIVASNTTYDQIYDVLTGSKNTWCATSASSSDLESCAKVLSSSLDEAIVELKKLRGSNAKDWRWGDIHFTLYSHSPFSNISSIAPLFERKIPSGGSANSVNVANAIYKESVGYEQTFGPGFRQVMQVGSDGELHDIFMNSTGQSGNVLSSKYDDMVKSFRDLEYIEMDNKQAAIVGTRITLMPE